MAISFLISELVAVPPAPTFLSLFQHDFCREDGPARCDSDGLDQVGGEIAVVDICWYFAGILWECETAEANVKLALGG